MTPLSRLAFNLILLTVCAQAILFAQKAPSPPPQQQPPSTTRSPAPANDRPPAQSPPPLYGYPLAPVIGDSNIGGSRIPITRVGQGTIYAPELNVPHEAKREYQKGMNALERKEIKRAEEHLLRAVELYPKFSSAFNALGIVYELDPEMLDKTPSGNLAAKNAFRQAVALNPANFDALVNLGYMLLQEKAGAEAERVLLTAAAVDATPAKTYLLIMRAQLMQQRYEDVLRTSERAAGRDASKDPAFYFLRANAWEGKSNPAKAISDYQEFLRRSPSAAEANLAFAALQRLKASQ